MPQGSFTQTVARLIDAVLVDYRWNAGRPRIKTKADGHDACHARRAPRAGRGR